MLKKLAISTYMVLTVLIGYVFWLFVNSDSKRIYDFSYQKSNQKLIFDNYLFKINGNYILPQDIQFEYDMYMVDLNQKKTEKQSEIKALKHLVIKNLIERKILFYLIQQDEFHNLNDKTKDDKCLKEFEDIIKLKIDLLNSGENKKRIKEKLCEIDMINRYLKENVYSSIKISNEEMKDFFIKNKYLFKQSKKVMIRHILLDNKEKAIKLRSILNIKNFAKMSKKHSLIYEDQNDGILTVFSNNSLPSIFNIAFHMKKNQISKIIKSKYGFHILLLLNKVKERNQEFKEVEKQIYEIIKKQKEGELYNEWIKLALRTISISVL